MYASGYRALIKLCMVLAAIPLFYYVVMGSIAYVTGPDLFDGDQLEERTCRECGGAGKDPSPVEEQIPQLGGRCPACAGKGSVQVIVPGAHRPTRLWGLVIDLAEASDILLELNPLLVKKLPVQGLLGEGARVVHGAISSATVRLLPATGDAAIEVKADIRGRFTQRVVSGSYTVQVHAPGFDRLEETLEVPPLRDPIWLERAQIVRPDTSASENQASYGLIVVVAVPRSGEYGGLIRVGLASP